MLLKVGVQTVMGVSRDARMLTRMSRPIPRSARDDDPQLETLYFPSSSAIHSVSHFPVREITAELSFARKSYPPRPSSGAA